MLLAILALMRGCEAWPLTSQLSDCWPDIPVCWCDVYLYGEWGVGWWKHGNRHRLHSGQPQCPRRQIPATSGNDLSTGLLSVYVNDGNTSQWVQVSPVPAQPLATVITTDALANNGLQVNGGMEISQELGATALATGGGWLVDQWSGSLTASGAVASWQQVTDAPPGYNNSVKLTITTGKASLAAGDYCVFYQNIEGYRTSRLQWGKVTAQPVSIGFWTKIHRPGMYSGAVRNEATNRSYPFTFTQNVADTWEYKTVTIPVTRLGLGQEIPTLLVSPFYSQQRWARLSVLPLVRGRRATSMGATGTTNGIAAATDTSPAHRSGRAPQALNCLRPPRLRSSCAHLIERYRFVSDISITACLRYRASMVRVVRL